MQNDKKTIEVYEYRCLCKNCNDSNSIIKIIFIIHLLHEIGGMCTCKTERGVMIVGAKKGWGYKLKTKREEQPGSCPSL